MNHLIHGFRGREWKYSSLLDYLGKRKGGLCNKKVIMKNFKSCADYRRFLEENAAYMKEKKEDEKYLLE